MSKNSLEQKKLKKFLDRRHPEYNDKKLHWEFLEKSYSGGRDWFPENIFPYIKEGTKEFEGRLARAYRFNHTKEVVDLVDKHLFKQEISRSEDAPQSVKKFWNSATLNGLSVQDFIKQVSRKGSIFGRPWIVVDSNRVTAPISIADEKKEDIRVYAYIVDPRHVMDMSYDERGELNWILIHEQIRDDIDPIESSGQLRDRYRLWTREDWTLFTVIRQGRDVFIEKDGPHPHELGLVPVFPADYIVSDELYATAGLIDDVAYLDRAVANYLSCLDAIVQGQTFSQLVMPTQAIPVDERDNVRGKLIEMGTQSIFAYDGEGGQPFYLSPDVKQAELILAVIHKIINEIYHTVGLAGERTKDDNSQGIDNSSGVAKAYDFERVNSLLAAKADALEMTENRLVTLVAKWNGEEIDPTKRFVSYPDNFDVRGLYDEFEIAARLSLVEAPDMVRRQQMEMLIDKLFPKIKQELRDKMTAELKSWPPELPVDTTGSGSGNAKNPIKKEGKNSMANSLVKGKK